MSTWAVAHLDTAFKKSLKPLVKAPQRVKKRMRITMMSYYVPGVITRGIVVPCLRGLLALNLQNFETNLNTFFPLWKAKPHLGFPTHQTGLQYTLVDTLVLKSLTLFWCVLSLSFAWWKRYQWKEAGRERKGPIEYLEALVLHGCYFIIQCLRLSKLHVQTFLL